MKWREILRQCKFLVDFWPFELPELVSNVVHMKLLTAAEYMSVCTRLRVLLHLLHINWWKCNFCVLKHWQVCVILLPKQHCHISVTPDWVVQSLLKLCSWRLNVHKVNRNKRLKQKNIKKVLFLESNCFFYIYTYISHQPKAFCYQKFKNLRIFVKPRLYN